MPSFLSKVFGRKKDDKDSSPTNQLGPGELLGGKFEAISPNVSPNAPHYLELPPDPTKVPGSDTDAGRIVNEEKEFGLPFFRIISRPSSPEVKPKKLFDTLPPLSLDFNDFKDKSAHNGYIFEESNSEPIFSDTALDQRRLNPMEVLILIRACSKAITSRGVETLGIMTPHWYSASPDVQRRLISKFLRSLDLTRSTAGATPSSPFLTHFEDEVDFTRSIHDIAAVFRWGLRHAQLEGDSFGTNDGWYKAFLDSEAANDYPPKAFSEKLAPSLPASHLDLVISTLEIFSSLSAFSELNSTSGSKLSKIFGLWLLTARRVEHNDDWRTFYSRWERAGRMLEHLFLARIRDQSTDQRMPTRLLELVRNYPFTHGLSSPTTDLQLLPYPQFTTPRHPALFVRVQYEVPTQERIPKTKINPSVLLADAFSTKVEGEFVDLWTKITSAASKTGSEFPLGNVLANESLRIMSLVADKSTEEVKSPAFSIISLAEPRQQGASSSTGATSVSPLKPSTESAPLTTTALLSPIGSDWEQFSASGFLGIDQTFPPLVSTLFDTDVEKTEPRDLPFPISRKSSKRVGRKSLELARSIVIADTTGNSEPEPVNLKSSSKARQEVVTVSQLEIIELDEAFVDFWSDSLLDPIASDWPRFFVCKFKPSLVPDLTFGTRDETTQKTLKWLVIEQVYSVTPHPVPSSPLPTSAESFARPASPIAQTPSSRRLFNFWSMSRTPSTSSTGSQKTKKTLKTPKVGEMGELIEEDEDKRVGIKTKFPGSKKFRSLDLPGVNKHAGKESNKLEENPTSSDVTRPATDIDARVTSSTMVAAGAVAAAAATTAAVGLATKKESDVEEVNLSTTPEAIAESSEPVLVSESTDGASKQDAVPVVAVTDVEKADVATIRAAVPEQDSQIIDAGAAGKPAIASVPETATVADERQSEELSKGERDPVSGDSTSADASSIPLEVALPIQQQEEVEQLASISSAIFEPNVADNPVHDEVTVVSEEHQAPLITGEDERVEISGEELEGVSEKPGLEGEKEGELEPFSLTERTTTVSADPEVEAKVTEPDSKINEHEINVELPAVEVKPDALRTLSVPDETLATGAEEVETGHEAAPISSITAPTVVEEPAIEAYPELYERGPPIEDVSKSITVAPTEVFPPIEGTVTSGTPGDAVGEVGPDESFVDGVPTPGNSASPIVDIEEVLPNAESPAVIEVPPISSDASAPVTQAAEELPVGAEIAIPQEVSVHSLEVAGAAVETLSEEIIFVEPAINEFQATEVLEETAVKEPEAFVDAPVPRSSEPDVEIVTPQEEATETVFAEPEPLNQVINEHPIIIEGSPALDIGVEGSVAAGEGASVDEEGIFVEEHSQKVPAVESEPPTRQTFAPEDTLPPFLEIRSVVESEVPPADPTSEETSEQPGPELPAPEAVASPEQPSQKLPAFEETSIQLETEEPSLVRPPQEEPLEEPAIETKYLPATGPELPIKELESSSATEVLQVVGEPDATNGPPLTEDVTHKEAEVAVLDGPEREVMSSTSEIPDSSMPEEEIRLEVPEQDEGILEPALPTPEDARASDVPADEPPPTAEVTPPPEAESLPDETPATDGVTATEEVRVAEETPLVEEVVGDMPEPISEITTEINDAPPENVAVVVPKISEESPAQTIPVTPEEPVPSVIATVDAVPSEAQIAAKAPAAPDVVEDDPAITEEAEVVVNAEVSINVAEEAPTAPALPVDEAPEQPKDVSADEDASMPIVETFVHEASLLDGTPDEELLSAETSTVAQATLPTIEGPITEESPALSDEPVGNTEVSAAAEQPSHLEESLLNVADAEKNTLAETSIFLGESPLADEVTIPEEGPLIIVEKVSAVDGIVPHAVDVPVEEIPEDASVVLASDAEASPEVVPQLDQETAADPPETSSAPEFASEQPAETSDRKDNTDASTDPADIDQPIHIQEVDLPTVEGGIIDEPLVVQSAARDDLPDEQTILDAPVASSTIDIPTQVCEAEPAHIDNRLGNEVDDTTANHAISETEPVEILEEDTPRSIIDPSIVEPEIDPILVAEPSAESADTAHTEQSEHPVEDIPELINANQPTILGEVVEVPTFIGDRPAVPELSGEHAIVPLEESELASQLPNGDGHATEATNTVVAPDVEFKAVADESAASEPSEASTAFEKLKAGTVATDAETTQADPIATDEAQ